VRRFDEQAKRKRSNCPPEMAGAAPTQPAAFNNSPRCVGDWILTKVLFPSSCVHKRFLSFALPFKEASPHFYAPVVPMQAEK
jgi:hypothetical protein